MTSVLVSAPDVGSVWGTLVEWDAANGYVVLEVLDDSDVGSPYMPDDYRGMYIYQGFPLSCVRKVSDSRAPYTIASFNSSGRVANKRKGASK